MAAVRTGHLGLEMGECVVDYVVPFRLEEIEDFGGEGEGRVKEVLREGCTDEVGYDCGGYPGAADWGRRVSGRFGFRKSVIGGF